MRDAATYLLNKAGFEMLEPLTPTEAPFTLTT